MAVRPLVRPPLSAEKRERARRSSFAFLPALLLALVASACFSRSLSRTEAAKLIRASGHVARVLEEKFSTGATAELRGIHKTLVFERLAEFRDLSSILGAEYRVDLRPGSRETLEQAGFRVVTTTALWLDWQGPIADWKFLEVSGIAEETRVTSRAEYRWRWEPRGKLGAALKETETRPGSRVTRWNNQVSIAHCRRFDDGWRVESVEDKTAWR